MRDDEATPSMVRGLFRIAVLFAVVALASYFLWNMYSESAALGRLTATANNFPYTERCDLDGNLLAAGAPNCVDLDRYIFVHGPINRAFRRACSGEAAGMLLFEKGKVARTEINLVEKMLQFRAQNGVNSGC